MTLIDLKVAMKLNRPYNAIGISANKLGSKVSGSSDINLQCQSIILLRTGDLTRCISSHIRIEKIKTSIFLARMTLGDRENRGLRDRILIVRPRKCPISIESTCSWNVVFKPKWNVLKAVAIWFWYLTYYCVLDLIASSKRTYNFSSDDHLFRTDSNVHGGSYRPERLELKLELFQHESELT